MHILLFTWALGSCVDGNSPGLADQKTVFLWSPKRSREKVTLQKPIPHGINSPSFAAGVR